MIKKLLIIIFTISLVNCTIYPPPPPPPPPPENEMVPPTHTTHPTLPSKTVDAQTMGFVNTGIVQNPLIADLDVVGSRVEGTAEGDGRTRITLENLMNYAVKDALSKRNADVLIDPRFEVSAVSDSLTIVNVTGFPALYRNFRIIQNSDFERLERLNAINEASIGDNPIMQLLNTFIPRVLQP